MPNDNDSASSGGGQEVVTVESLQEKLDAAKEQIDSLTGESTKQKNLRRKAEKERDELKKKVKPTSNDDDESEDDDEEEGEGNKKYKKLWKDANAQTTKLLERAKKADINTALTAQFGKAKVAADRYSAALQLIDHSLVEWNDDTGVDGDSVEAAVQGLKKNHPFLFEQTVSTTNPKKPGKQGGDGKTISRTAFLELGPTERLESRKAGVKVVDD